MELANIQYLTRAYKTYLQDATFMLKFRKAKFLKTEERPGISLCFI